VRIRESQKLRELSHDLCRKTGNIHWFELSESLKKAVFNEKALYPNMGFYSATLCYALGIPVDMLTTMFACSRMAGWTSHIVEQYELDRLIRPLGDYTGNLDRKYIPIEQRNTGE
jgi:citrate synthase